MRIALLSLVATTLFSTAIAQYNALLDLTNTYYPGNQDDSVYICANSCIDDVGSPPDCDLSKSCWCSSPDSNLIDYACCLSSCRGTVQDTTRNIGDWCSSVASRPWEPPTCVNGKAQRTTAISSRKRSYYGNDGNQFSLSTGAVMGLVLGVFGGLVALILLCSCCCTHSSVEPAATNTAPALPLHEIRPHLPEEAPPRVQTPPPPYSAVPLDREGPKDT